MHKIVLMTCLLLLAGCSESPAASEAPDGERTSSTLDHERAPTAFENVSWDGDLGTHLCAAPAGTEICPIGQIGPPMDVMDRESLLFFAQTQGPAFLSGNLSLTWESQEFAITHQLVATLGLYAQCPDACTFVRAASMQTGKSPLALPLDGIQLADGERLGMSLRPVRSQVVNTAMVVAAGQAVHLEGTVGSAPA